MLEVALVLLLPFGGHHQWVCHLLLGPQPAGGGRISAGFCSGEVYETTGLSAELSVGLSLSVWLGERRKWESFLRITVSN